MRQIPQADGRNVIHRIRSLFKPVGHGPILIIVVAVLVGSSLVIGLAQDSHPPTSSPADTVFDHTVHAAPPKMFVKGKILDIQNELTIIVEGIDGPVELQITEDTVFQSSLHIGDHIVASVSPQGNVHQITVVESKDWI